MKKIIKILIFLIILLNSFNTFGLSVNEETNYIIGKISSEGFYMISKVDYNILSEEERNNKNYIKLDFDGEELQDWGYDSSWFYGNAILFTNNYLLSKNGYITGNIGKNIIKKLQSSNIDYNIGDVIIYEKSILNENDLVKDFFGNNIVMSYWSGITSDLNENTYKVECNNNIFSFVKINNGLNDLNKTNFKKYLEKEIKTCYNFYYMFDKEKNFLYRNNSNYSLKKQFYIKVLQKQFISFFSKLDSEIKIILIKKIENLRKQINNNLDLNKKEIENKNILLDAISDILNK